MIAPDGPGTIPGGAPSMQTTDFWSIPFVDAPAPRTPPEAPTLLGRCLERIAAPGAPLPDPLRYDAGLGTWLSAHLGRGWLPIGAQLRATIALGIVDEDDLVAASGLDRDAAASAFDVADAIVCFSSRE